MTDNENILLEDFFKEAALQQIEDNGFTEQVMNSLPRSRMDNVRLWSRLWTWFCILISVALFFIAGGWQMLISAFAYMMRMTLAWLSVFITTAPTAEIRLDPVVVLLAVAFVLVFLPYQTYRKLSATL